MAVGVAVCFLNCHSLRAGVGKPVSPQSQIPTAQRLESRAENGLLRMHHAVPIALHAEGAEEPHGAREL